MIVTDEMAKAALRRVQEIDGEVQIGLHKSPIDVMRAALEAALVAAMPAMPQSAIGVSARLRNRNIPYGWLELADIAASCIEDIAAALRQVVEAPNPSPYSTPGYDERIAKARTTLARWGLENDRRQSW